LIPRNALLARIALEPPSGIPTIQGMATHRAISVIGKSIIGILAEKCPKPEFTGATFVLFQSSDFAASKRPLFGISLCLGRVSVDAAQRHLVPPTAPDGRRIRPALPLELYFVLTTWAKTPDRQHDLLGWAMCVLDDNPVLPASVLNRFAGGTSAVFGPDERVEIVPANFDFEQMRSVGGLLQLQQHPSVVYVASPVLIQSSVT
jgi:hypothetical protein